MTELDLGWGFFAFLVIGGFGVFLQRGAPYFLPRAIIEWPVLKTLNRLLPAALILLFFLVTWVTTFQAGTLKLWVVIAEIVILLLAILMQVIFRRVAPLPGVLPRRWMVPFDLLQLVALSLCCRTVADCRVLVT